MNKKKETINIENQSVKNQLKYAKKRLAELERLNDIMDFEIEFRDRVIEVIEKEYGIDLRKEFSKL